MSLGPFDLTSGPFLILYIVLLVGVVIAGLIIPRRLRPEGRRQRVTDVDQLAYLSGGAARFADAVVARLLAARALIMLGRDSFTVAGAERVWQPSPVERSVLTRPSPFRWRELERTLHAYAEPLAQRMQQASLLITDAERANLRFWALLPYLMLLTFGATKWVIGDMRERPIGFLSLLLLVTAIFALIRWFSIDRRTRAGIEAVTDERLRNGRVKNAPNTDEIGLGVALFGTAVLVGSGFTDFHRLRTAGDGGSSGSDGGDGGSGCGGGGCGGCS